MISIENLDNLQWTSIFDNVNVSAPSSLFIDMIVNWIVFLAIEYKIAIVNQKGIIRLGLRIQISVNFNHEILFL